VGVYKDISENYFVKITKPKAGRRLRRSKPRYTDSACIFSKSPFTDEAQGYAWAQNIFLFSFDGIDLLRPMIDRIDNFLTTKFPSDNSDLDCNRKELLEEFGRFRYDHDNQNLFHGISFVVGVLNKKYPIILVGDENLLEYLRSKKGQPSDILEAVKNFRRELDLDVLFNLQFRERMDGRSIHFQFCVPNGIASHLISRIDAAPPRRIIFRIDIPFVAESGHSTVRRIYKISVKLDP
jgi:hypothetical protein